MAKLFHPLLTLIASATDRELAKYVQFLKEENNFVRSRLGGEVHTRPEERQRLLEFGKALGRAIEKLITIVSPATFYRWVAAVHRVFPVKCPVLLNRHPNKREAPRRRFAGYLFC